MAESVARSEPISLQGLVDALETRVSTLEVKMDDLYMRPRMPYTQGATSGDVLELDIDLIPRWVAVA